MAKGYKLLMYNSLLIIAGKFGLGFALHFAAHLRTRIYLLATVHLVGM